MIGKAVYGILSADAGVSALVGTRIYPTRATQAATPPYIVYSIVNELPIDTKDSPEFETWISVQVDIYGLKYGDDIAAIAEACRTALDRYSGTVNSLNIDQVYYEGQQDLPIVEDVDLFRRNQDYKIHLKR